MVDALSSVNTKCHRRLIGKVKFSGFSLGGGIIWTMSFFSPFLKCLNSMERSLNNWWRTQWRRPQLVTSSGRLDQFWVVCLSASDLSSQSVHSLLGPCLLHRTRQGAESTYCVVSNACEQLETPRVGRLSRSYLSSIGESWMDIVCVYGRVHLSYLFYFHAGIYYMLSTSTHLPFLFSSPFSLPAYPSFPKQFPFCFHSA